MRDGLTFTGSSQYIAHSTMPTRRRRRCQIPLQTLYFSFAPFLLGAILATCCASPTQMRSKFKAAVYEHAVILPEDPKQIVPRSEALQTMMRNLEVYETQAAEAKRQGADILVFPEDGLYGFSFTWDSIDPYLEYIPDPTVVDWIPCVDPTRFENTEVQQRLSCMARNNGLYLVANMGDKQPCHFQRYVNCNHNVNGNLRTHFHYNTDVAFDPTGKLVARYHKEHLFFEEQFDTPEKVELSTFNTPFGRWAMFTCFDILFLEPAVTVIEREGIANIAFPTAWMDALPLLASIQFHSAFARGMGVNFLAANIHLPEFRFHGSGVYTPEGMASFVHNATVGSKPRLLVTEIDTLEKPLYGHSPRLPRQSTHHRHSHHHNRYNPDYTQDAPTVDSSLRHAQARAGRKEPQHSAITTLDMVVDAPPPPKTEFVSELFHDLYNFVQLDDDQGTVSTCSNQTCCHLTYSMNRSRDSSDPPDLFALGAFDGLHTYEGQYYLQICALVRCASQSQHSCGTPTTQSSTMFRFLSLRGKFQTEHVYPEVLLTTETQQLRLAEAAEWRYDAHRGIHSQEGFSHPLLSAALFGRWYSRDEDLLESSPLEDKNNAATSVSGPWKTVVGLCAFFMFTHNVVSVFFEGFEIF